MGQVLILLRDYENMICLIMKIIHEFPKTNRNKFGLRSKCTCKRKENEEYRFFHKKVLSRIVYAENNMGV